MLFSAQNYINEARHSAPKESDPLTDFEKSSPIPQIRKHCPINANDKLKEIQNMNQYKCNQIVVHLLREGKEEISLTNNMLKMDS